MPINVFIPYGSKANSMCNGCKDITHCIMFFYAFVVIKTMQNVGIEWIVNKRLMEVGHD